MTAGDATLGELAVRLLGSLAIVVGLLLLIARFVNRRFKAPTGAAIQVVHRQALGRGQGVAVVSVGTRVLVLGTTEQQVTLLAEVEPDEVGLDVGLEGDLDGHAAPDDAGRHDAEPATFLQAVQAVRTAAPRTPVRTVRGGAHRAAVPVNARTARDTATAGPLAGSVLSPQTWKQTIAAVTGRRAS